MAACCGCCSALKPRYKRLVDNIFPADPQDGLVKSNMEKLTFFAMKSPEKLDRIGEYLAQRLSREVSRQRTGYVIISMEALDTLLVTCHAHTLNLFVESFLKMVKKLLESNNPELQILATSSFVKFANIEEDVPSYHRTYDFFVYRFSLMGRNVSKDENIRNKLRLAGLEGLRGVVRKTVGDELQANIWEHMERIIPPLLFNMHDPKSRHSIHEHESPQEERSPSVEAESVFRDLICRASYGNIRSVIIPVLLHLDENKLWVPNTFAVKCFKIIMYSVQAQYGYNVTQLLLTHLDKHIKLEARLKTSIVDVLYETVVIAAGGSFGPSVLDSFNNLLKHLRVSVDTDSNDTGQMEDEKVYQEAIINTIGEFANNLPDYQKIEVMMFVISTAPRPSSEEEGPGNPKDVLLLTMLLKTLLKVATKYKTVLMSNAFSSSFLEPLLRISLSSDPGIRRLVQEILHTLLDRHDNLDKLKPSATPWNMIYNENSDYDLAVEKAPRQDLVFMKKHGTMFYTHIYENISKKSNRVDNFETLYTTLALLCVELGGGEILIDLFRLALSLQEMALQKPLPITHKCAIQALVASYMHLMSQLTAIPSLCNHVNSVIRVREKKAKYYLPAVAFNRANKASSYPITDTMDSAWLFDMHLISEALKTSGHDTTRLGIPYTPKAPPLDTVDHGRSVSDIHSVSALSIDIQSNASTPGVSRRNEKEIITFDSLKKMLEIDPKVKEEHERKQKEILQAFKTAPFEELVERCQSKSLHLDNTLNEILDKLSKPKEKINNHEAIPISQMKFPKLFIY